MLRSRTLSTGEADKKQGTEKMKTRIRRNYLNEVSLMSTRVSQVPEGFLPFYRRSLQRSFIRADVR